MKKRPKLGGGHSVVAALRLSNPGDTCRLEDECADVELLLGSGPLPDENLGLVWEYRNKVPEAPSWNVVLEIAAMIRWRLRSPLALELGGGDEINSSFPSVRPPSLSYCNQWNCESSMKRWTQLFLIRWQCEIDTGVRGPLCFEGTDADENNWRGGTSSCWDPGWCFCIAQRKGVELKAVNTKRVPRIEISIEIAHDEQISQVYSKNLREICAVWI